MTKSWEDTIKDNHWNYTTTVVPSEDCDVVLLVNGKEVEGKYKYPFQFYIGDKRVGNMILWKRK